MRGIRRHYGEILNNQHVEIGYLGQRLELLKIASGVLLVLLLLVRLSCNSCGDDLPNTSVITQECMEKKSLYGCDVEQPKSSHVIRKC